MDEIDQFIMDATTRKSHKIWEEGTKYLREVILPSLNQPLPNYVVIWAVKQARGRCYMKQRRITVPAWAFEKHRPIITPDWERKNKEYLQWYLSHELAHQADWDENKKGDAHGPNFMKHLIRICPQNALRFEVNYKPRNASAAGISNIDVNDL